jgi:hypothetical protein
MCTDANGFSSNDIIEHIYSAFKAWDERLYEEFGSDKERRRWHSRRP